MAARDVGDRLERIERAGVHVAGLRADDRRCIRGADRRRERLRTHPSLFVRSHAHQLTRTDAEHSQGANHRHVHFVADDNAQLRRILQSVGFDVPARPPEKLMSSRGERREVRHVAAGHEGNARVSGQAEQIDEPSPGDLFDDRCRRRHHKKRRVLVPGGRQPLGGHRGGQRAASHESEIARAAGRDETMLCGACEIVDYLGRIGWAGWQRRIEAGAQLWQCGCWPDRAIAARRDIDARDR